MGSEETTFQAGMCMKTNEDVRSPRSDVERLLRVARSILNPGSLLLTPVPQEMKVHPEMLLKTKESVRSPKSKGVCGGCADSDSRLLTPDSCSSRK